MTRRERSSSWSIAAAETGRRRPLVRALDPAEIARIAVLPATLATAASALLLGPPLGRTLLAPAGAAFWSRVPVYPQPTEHARYLIVLAGVVLLAGIVLLTARRAVVLSPRAATLLDRSAQALVLAVVVLSLLAQNDVLLRARVPPVIRDRIFTWPTLLAAALLPALALAALRRGGWARVRGPLAAETTGRRRACLLAAALLTALWLSTAVNTDATIGNAGANNLIPWDTAEAFAILDGRTPLVTFHSQYSQLLPYLPAAAMALLGATILTWTLAMTTLSGLALLGIYGTLRRIVRRSGLALALYLPFLATSCFLISGTRENRLTPAGIFSAWPMRYGGAYLLAWLTARHLDGAAPRRRWPLLLAGGLVALNNLEFGLGALAGTLLALALASRVGDVRAAARLLGAAAAGLAGAVVLVCALTLARAGALPRVGLLTEFPRLYGTEGWALWRMTPVGLHLILFTTFAGAIAVAVVRAVRDADDAVLTGMLGWSGVFGLGAGSYFAGRPDPLNLITLFSAWSLALVLLAVATVRALHARGWARPDVPQAAVLFGLGLMVCSLPQLPTPWSQVARLRQRTPAPVYRPAAARRLVAHTTPPGAKVAILIPLGHRIAYDTGRVDVAPYAGIEAMPTREQLTTTLRVMEREGVHDLFVETASALPEQLAALREAGFTARARSGPFVALSDRTP
jgi:hypothetical protein